MDKKGPPGNFPAGLFCVLGVDRSLCRIYYKEKRLFRRVTRGRIMRNEILYNQRKALGLTQKEVSQRVGIHPRQYQKFESGEKEMASASLRIALTICDLLKLDPHCFVAPLPKEK